MTGVIAFLFASALATDVMGIHALFGSFLAGVVMPARPAFREFLYGCGWNISARFFAAVVFPR